MKIFLKILFILIFFFSTFSNYLFPNCNDFSGIWNLCMKTYDISCDGNNSLAESFIKEVLSSSVNSCYVEKIDINNCEGEIINYFNTDEKTEVTIDNNSLIFEKKDENEDYIYSINLTCNMKDNKNFVVCNGIITIVTKGIISYKCNGSAVVNMYKIKVLKDDVSAPKINAISKDFINGLYLTNKGQWKLLGTSYEIVDFSIFQDGSTIWAWCNGQWKIYSNNSYILNLLYNYNIPLLTKIEANEGFWIKFKN